MARRAHLVECPGVAAKPREDLLGYSRVHPGEAAVQCLDIERRLLARPHMAVRMEPIHGPKLDLREGRLRLGLAVDAAAPVVYEAVATGVDVDDFVQSSQDLKRTHGTQNRTTQTRTALLDPTRPQEKRNKPRSTLIPRRSQQITGTMHETDAHPKRKCTIHTNQTHQSAYPHHLRPGRLHCSPEPVAASPLRFCRPAGA